MTFININLTRLKVANILSYAPRSALVGTTTVYYIDVSLSGMDYVLTQTVEFSTITSQAAALQQLDAAVLAFNEPPNVLVDIYNPIQPPHYPGYYFASNSTVKPPTNT